MSKHKKHKKHKKHNSPEKESWEKKHPGLQYLSNKDKKKWLKNQKKVLDHLKKRKKTDALAMWSKNIYKADDMVKASWLKMQWNNLKIDAEKKIAKMIVHPFKVLVDLALMPGKMATFTMIAPFVGGMAAYLKKHNVKVPGSKLDYMENLARQFYQVAILKKAPLTKGVGLASLESLQMTEYLEHADGDSNDKAGAAMGAVTDVVGGLTAKGKPMGDKVVDTISAGAAKYGGIYGKVGAAIMQIIKAIVHFFTGMKKKSAAAKKGITLRVDPNAHMGTPDALSPEEAAAIGDHPVDHDIADSADKIQDTMVANGVGNLKSNGVAKIEPPKETGLIGFLHRLFGIKPKAVSVNVADVQQTSDNSVHNLDYHRGVAGRLMNLESLEHVDKRN